ncbi:ABC transporter permease subunit [Escherichia coli]
MPDSLREAAYALGTPKWKMISAITLKASVSGIMTGILLAIARIAGETAPLLFTALSNQFWGTDMMQPIANLPVTILKFAMSPFADGTTGLGRGIDYYPVRTAAEHSGARCFWKNKHG